ncbi:MAG: hypothetical protein R2789_11840 [Microthrixaceae bacterium]
MQPAARNAIAAVLVLVAIVGLVFTVRLAVTGDANTSDAARLRRPTDSRLRGRGARPVVGGSGPCSGLLDAYLIVNGTEIRTEADGLTKDLGLAR